MDVWIEEKDGTRSSCVGSWCTSGLGEECAGEEEVVWEDGVFFAKINPTVAAATRETASQQSGKNEEKQQSELFRSRLDEKSHVLRDPLCSSERLAQKDVTQQQPQSYSLPNSFPETGVEGRDCHLSPGKPFPSFHVPYEWAHSSQLHVHFIRRTFTRNQLQGRSSHDQSPGVFCLPVAFLDGSHPNDPKSHVRQFLQHDSRRDIHLPLIC